jgi:hypothetical protein
MSYLIPKIEPPKPKKEPTPPRQVSPNALLQKGEMGGSLKLALVFARKYANTKKSRWFKAPLDKEGFSLEFKGEADMEEYRQLCRDVLRSMESISSESNRRIEHSPFFLVLLTS